MLGHSCASSRSLGLRERAAGAPRFISTRPGACPGGRSGDARVGRARAGQPLLRSSPALPAEPDFRAPRAGDQALDCPAGCEQRAGGLRRCTPAWSPTSWPPTGSSPTTPRCLCSTRGAAGPRSDGFGPTRGTTGRSAARHRRRSPSSTPPDRKGIRPAEHLGPFRGILQVDGYAGFEALAEAGAVTLAACWRTCAASSTSCTRRVRPRQRRR